MIRRSMVVRYAPMGASMIAAIACFLGFAAQASAQEMVDNPLYTAWAKLKPGSAITYAMETQAAGQNITGTMAYKLTEVTAEQVTVEISQTMQVMGQTHSSPPHKQVYKAKVAKADADVTKLPPNVKGTVKDLPDETIEVGGKSYKCKVAEYEGTTSGGMQAVQVKGKIWRSDEVPSGMVKVQTDTQGPMASTMTMTLKSLELK